MHTNNWNTYWGKSEQLDYWRIPAPEVIEFLSQVDKTKHKKVLDLGCGLGRHSLLFAENGFEVCALDYSSVALSEIERISREKKLEIKPLLGTYQDQQFEENSFDIILSFNALYHGTKAEFSNAISQCRCYLKNEGLLFFTCPTRKDGKSGSGEKIEEHTYASLNSVHSGDIHYFSDEDDINEFTEGFEVISKEIKEHYWLHNGIEQFSSFWVVSAQKK